MAKAKVSYRQILTLTDGHQIAIIAQKLNRAKMYLSPREVTLEMVSGQGQHSIYATCTEKDEQWLNGYALALYDLIQA